MLIIETKSYRGLSCYRKVLFVSAPDHQVAKEKARDWCDGEQITSISILPFDPNRMGDSLIDSTEKSPFPEHPNIDTRWISKYKTAEAFYKIRPSSCESQRGLRWSPPGHLDPQPDVTGI